jgi:hypothetical protein
VEAARLQLSYGVITSPGSGRIAKRNAEPGQLVQPGQSLMAVVDDSTVWVVANMKETQLENIRPGQPVEVTVDAYGGHVFNGQVESIQGATGARFALLPPDKRNRQLHQGGPAGPGEDPAGPVLLWILRAASGDVGRGRHLDQGETRQGRVSASAIAIAGAEPAENPHAGKWMVAVGVTLGSVLELIDTSIVNVALSHISANLGVSVDEVAWVSVAYILAAVIILPMTGWLAAYFGRKRYFIWSILIFTTASFFCGAARSLGEPGHLADHPGAGRWRAHFYRPGHPVRTRFPWKNGPWRPPSSASA